MIEASQVLILGIIGLSAGLVGGMLGIGGSIIMIPALTEATGPNQHLYQAAAMIVNFFVVVPAVVHHRRAGTIDAATVVRLVPPAIAAVIVGVGISELPVFAAAGEAYLRLLFGLFLLTVAGYDLYRLYRTSDAHRLDLAMECATPSTHLGDRPWRLIAVAVPTGLLAGLLGIGGGLLAVPLQRRVLHLPLRVAIANSATVIIATSFIGAGVKNYAYVVEHDYTLRSFVLAGVLIPTAIIGSMCGSRLTYRLPLRLVKTAFFILLAVAAVRLTRGATRSLEIFAEPPVVKRCVTDWHHPSEPIALWWRSP